MVVGEPVANLLRSSYRPEDFNAELEFGIFTATSRDSRLDSIRNGVSFFLDRCAQRWRTRWRGRLGHNGSR